MHFKRGYPRKNGARRFWQSYTVLGRLHKHRKRDVPDTDLEDLRSSLLAEQEEYKIVQKLPLDGVIDAHSPDGGEEEVQALQGRPVEESENFSTQVDGDAPKLLGT